MYVVTLRLGRATLLQSVYNYDTLFLQFTFATNTATILGGTLVGQGVQMRAVAIFVYSFVMTVSTYAVFQILQQSCVCCLWYSCNTLALLLTIKFAANCIHCAMYGRSFKREVISGIKYMKCRELMVSYSPKIHAYCFR